jgi:hypothetical protein
MDPDPDPDPGPRRHPTDTQRDGNEGVVIALRGLQANLMSGGSAKNDSFPQFDGTSIGYLRFKQRWKTFQEFYHTSTPESELVYKLRDRCMKKKMADKIRHEETIEGCLKTLGKHYYQPVKAAKELMAEITAFKKMRGNDYGRLFEYYATLRTRIGEAEREKDLSYLLLQPENLILMESVLPTREQELWRNTQGDERPPDLGKVFKEFIAERESWARRQVAHSTAPPPPDREGAARTSGPREQPTPVAAIDQQRRSWPARRPKGGVAGRQMEPP